MSFAIKSVLKSFSAIIANLFCYLKRGWLIHKTFQTSKSFDDAVVTVLWISTIITLRGDRVQLTHSRQMDPVHPYSLIGGGKNGEVHSKTKMLGKLLKSKRYCNVSIV